MGGLFKAPKPKIIAPPSRQAVTASQQAVTATPPAPDAVASETRIESREGATRGLPGTIATSARGLLDAMPSFLTTRRSLLGE